MLQEYCPEETISQQSWHEAAWRNSSFWPVAQLALMKWSPFYMRHLQSWVKSGLQLAMISQAGQLTALVLRQLNGKLCKQ